MGCRVRAAAALAAIAALIGVCPSASASYPGRPGRIALEYYRDDRGNGGIGPSHETFGLAFADRTGAATSRPARLRCTAVDGAVRPRGRMTEVCPFSSFDVAYPGPGLGEAWAVDGGPSWSPDGRELAFSGAEYLPGGARTPSVVGCPACESLFVTRPGGAPRRVPVEIAGAQQPAFLPGGRRLLFTGRTGGRARPELYTVGTDGVGLTRLTVGGADEGAPCPDGSIAYVHDRGVYLRSPDGDARRLAVRGTLPECSPDSTEIAFVRGTTLYTIDRGGTDLRRLIHGVDGRAAFSPAGGELAVTVTTLSPGCHSRSGDTRNWLEVIDLRRDVRHRSLIDLVPCARDFPTVDPADVGWQPLPGVSPATTRRRRRP